MRPIVYNEHWRMAMQVQLAALVALHRMRRLNPESRIRFTPNGARCQAWSGRRWDRLLVDCGGWNLPTEQQGPDRPG